ncbi:SDR family oxidoreductase [Dietzia sp.]|uniref:SDR family oxidoreductase n=1 Tax=Dietzia sp. TaxID=1871616 RepID=UPI002FD8ACF9
MSHYTILGGHGKVALRTAELLAQHDDQVTSVIRNADHAADIEAVGAAPLVLDIETADVDALAAAFEGTDGVIFSAGAGGGNPDRTYAVDRDAAIRSMDAAKKAGVERYIIVSYDGAGPDHGVDPDNSFYPYAEAKAAADEHLRASELEWTILQPGALTLDEPTGSIGVGDEKREDRKTSRGNVASTIVACLRRSDTAHRTIAFSDGPTPIGEAITRE